MAKPKRGVPKKVRVPTIQDVARLAKVAPATVSNVLNDSRPVAAIRKERVLAAVQALGYRPNALAASLRRKETRTIGIVVPDLTNPFFGALVHRIEELAAESDYQILLVSSNEDPKQEAARIRTLLDRRIDGLIVAPARDEVEAVSHPIGALPPTVLVDRGFGLAGFDTIAADNVEAGHRGCQHLLELGHRDIALIAMDPKLANFADRIAGYRKALAEAGAGRRARVVTGGLDVESCRTAIERELRRPDRPTAIFAASYVATLGAIKAIRAVGLDLPGDVSLLGIDDADWMEALHPYISAVAQPVEQMATEAWRLLNQRLAGGTAKSARIRLPCTLHVRESTRAVR
ncbi:LacI family DNA-binding transcriptional regulator [Dongia sedimenti]|uniref:LacI family DNA-binding transcriptional regulator n=1 Tax=Dongia sedimenti TaxID=3064282 RepID=A0ABU0YFU9_9PROT|nr:LacI family DNA-binding transcriptional regulator [Rhodospirillaceae bacterium R-7]